MMIVISSFALKFIQTDRATFKIVDLYEAWTFLQVAQGKTLANKLVRAGRAMNAAVYFVTQNTDDLLDEKMKNNIGMKFAFRSTDINEIEKTFQFYGIEKTDENVDRIKNLDNGECLFQDIWGRTGVVKFDAVFDDLFRAFDTRPPLENEVA
ncbi:ATP-binding protein, partial [Listeria seeligeri]|uniref:ATP-binding protein n=1 Tax=Listeria seeligeri TaxID=1640 RepID=UPI00188709AE